MLNTKMKRFHRGDTIVETMFAFTIFSLIAIVSIQIMQQGIRLNQTALEINLAREYMDSQAEALRLINMGYLNSRAQETSSPSQTLWNNITSRAVVPSKIKDLGSLAANSCPGHIDSVNSQAFVLGVAANDLPQLKSGTTVIKSGASVYPRLVYSSVGDSNIIDKSIETDLITSEGIWIEAVKPVTGNYYDFLIRSCWDSVSSSTPTTLETLVRLYHVP